MKSLLKFTTLLAVCLNAAGARAADTAWPKIESKDWRLASSTDERRFYIKPSAPGPRHPRLLLRFETREAQTVEGSAYRSMQQAMEFNCAKNTARILVTGVYKNNNLKGLLDSELGDGEWRLVKADTYVDLAAKLACADFAPAPPREAWPTLRTGDWELIEDEDDAKTYAMPEWRRAYPRAWMRTEYLEPQEFNNRAYRSARSLVEFDCKKMRVRTSLGIQYPQNNLQGVADMSGAMSEWFEPDLSAPEALVAERVCYAETQPPAAGDPEDYGRLAVTEDQKYKGVQALDWAPFGVLRTARIFVQAANGGLYPQVFVRIEFLTPLDLGEMKAKSSVIKYEVDCAGRRVREKSNAVYAGSNLKGKGMDATDPEAQWRSIDTDEKLPLEVLEPLCDLGLDGDKGVGPKPLPPAAPPPAGVAGTRSSKAAA